MIHMKEAIVVEGRYDKIKLSSLVDALIVETNGFSIYKDKEKQAFLKALAAERGLVVLTDSDNAGRQIRNFIASFIPAEQLQHAYIPDIYGKERRKATPSKEGKLGVEGVSAEALLQALQETGIASSDSPHRAVTLSTSDCMELGLTGYPDSAVRRSAAAKALGLPENMTLKMLQRWVDTEEKLVRLLRILENFDAEA